LGILALPFVGIIGDALGLRVGMAMLTPMLLSGALIIASAGRLVNADIANVSRPSGEELIVPPPESIEGGARARPLRPCIARGQVT
jgi:hypothetical protein